MIRFWTKHDCYANENYHAIHNAWLRFLLQYPKILIAPPLVLLCFTDITFRHNLHQWATKIPSFCSGIQCTWFQMTRMYSLLWNFPNDLILGDIQAFKATSEVEQLSYNGLGFKRLNVVPGCKGLVSGCSADSLYWGQNSARGPQSMHPSILCQLLCLPRDRCQKLSAHVRVYWLVVQRDHVPASQ